MRLLPFFFASLVTILLLFLLNRPIGSKVPMPLGSFLSPQTGFWQNAEDTAFDYSLDVIHANLKGNAHVYFDERLVPHVFAEDDEDLYFIQGYLHARFRLFQMDLQTKAAEGRASEIAGPAAISYDKEQRRLGMKFAAENTLKEVQKDRNALARYTAYTAGVNAYINTLTESTLPLEYKILNFKPEEWSNLRTMLLLKMMAKMLSSGTEHDLEYTRLRAILSSQQMNLLYPEVPDSLVPIVPKGTLFPEPKRQFKFPDQVDSVYFNNQQTVQASAQYPEDNDNGSNNWVVAGSRTASGAPILCNDPHLELSLPSIWYEMQLSTPTSNSYGATLPGSPFVIIGFNDHIAWGVTNSQRDVKDYYTIRFKDQSRREYWFDDAWKPAQLRLETIKVKGGPTVIDTVAYTVFGPVLYDETYPDTVAQQAALAVKWTAHHTGDDGSAFYNLNRATDYASYVEAIKTFECPGQNFVFASKGGDIAIWQQGKFPDRWQGQGQYIMPGKDSAYLWQGFIPQDENPHALNPAQGYLQSANQRPVDGSYPYFIPGTYITPRGTAIDHFLNGMNSVTVDQMMQLQNNYYNILAKELLPAMIANTNVATLTPAARKYFDMLQQWDFDAGPLSVGQTIYQFWLDSLQKNVWVDELRKAGSQVPIPEQQTLMELIKIDTTLLGFVDDVNTPHYETLGEQLSKSLNGAGVHLAALEKEGKLEWAKFKEPTIYHLLKNNLPSFAVKNLPVGGAGTVINAIKKSHGPSWRMVVQLSAVTDAYGIYPGGQSGNPGSRFYDNAIDNWVKGKYYQLWMMKPEEASDKRIKWRMSFLTGKKV
ncbi:penicillin acylase family protein [Niabella insulamsoli]|uniref:penicillin acylase family protein n=1 Tax=Niabella insulamsoli TaxID=3144874 RepID=UPI0031FD872B